MRFVLLIALLLPAQPADAGAWLREQGAAFLSFKTTIEQNGQRNAAVYAEYGARPKLTLGVKADVGMVHGFLSGGRAEVFVRKPFPLGKRNFKLAYELGLGGAFVQTVDPLLRVGLNLGKGLTLRKTSGWLAIDASVEWASTSDIATVKLDTTLGFNLSAHFKVMMQIFHTDSIVFTETTLAPSVIWTPNTDKGISYQFGLETNDAGVLGATVGVWRSF